MIDAVSIKEGEGIPEGAKVGESWEKGDTGESGEKQEVSWWALPEAARAVKDTFNKCGRVGWKSITKTVDYTRHQPISLLLVGVGAGLMLGWFLCRRR